MPIVPIDSLGRYGIIQDKQPHKLPIEAWSGGHNVRFEKDILKKGPGRVVALGTPTVPPHFMMPYADPSTYYYFYANGTYIYRTDGSTHVNVTRYTTTPGDNNYTAPARPRWNGGVFNSVPIMNNGEDYPQQWNDSNSRFEDLSNWPVNTTAEIIKPYLSFLVAYKVDDGVKLDSNRVKWSSVADPGSVPATWVAGPTNQAGEISLAQTGDFISDAMAMKTFNVVYKEDHVWGMQYVGGQSIFRFWPMFDEFGMLSERCGCSFQRGHFVVAKNDIIVHNGSSWESVIDLKNRKAVFGSISNDYKEWTFVAHNPAKSEIYTCYVTTGNVYANRVAIWNYRDNTWTFDDLPGIAHGALGLDVTDTTTMTFDNLVGSFDEWQGTFDERRYNPAELNLFLADPVNTLFYRENVGTQRNGSDYSSWVERTGIAVAKMDRNNEPVIDLNSVKFVRGFWPKITGKVGVQINFYFATQDKPQDPVTWKGPFPFVIGTDTFVDFEISTVLYGVRASSTSDGDWEMSGYDVDLDVISRF